MKYSQFLSRIKPFMLPLAMLIGIVCHNVIGYVSFLAPYLIFVMLFVTFCRINPRHIHVGRLSVWCMIVQLVGSALSYFACLPLGNEIAQGVMICFFCPTATAAPVITGMLGGSVERVATYSLVSNIIVALLAPPVFSVIGAEGVDLLGATLRIAGSVIPLIIVPLLCAMLLRKVSGKMCNAVATHQGASFYLWSVSLIIVVGNAVSFVMKEPPSMIMPMILLAFLAGVACVIQFCIGRKIGAKSGDKIAGAQGLGQKNTVLAIWMALTYLNPLASIAPAAYIAWQNTINSLQLYVKSRKENK
ncbi:MAG: transporter [Bacteroides sp.]|nr:transporter [Bacteroides sp.]